ncbi:MAG: diguanylate cyclase [Gammaproteobacteria bacterium]|nr:diguanylate cyclase [Gammaproteobacteria bacterium]
MNTTQHNEKIIPKVLVVDDRQENLLAMEKVLAPLSLQLYRANSGEEALFFALEHDFAVILLDVQMPDMDGFEVADLMQSNEKTSHIPIIFVTALSKEEKYVSKGHEIGAVDYLFKPIDPIILKSKVNVFFKLYSREKILEQLLDENKEVKQELEKRNQELKHLASHDLLTKLPNRLKFSENIESILSLSKNNNQLFALLFIDLDDFKSVNDQYGHHVGDLLLQAVSDKLNNCFRKNDFVAKFSKENILARLGGDEFAVILNNLKDVNDAGMIAERAIKEVCCTYHLGGTDIHVSISIGIACFPSAGKDISTLCKNADAAMYVAKAKGKNMYQYYNDKLSEEHIE